MKIVPVVLLVVLLTFVGECIATQDVGECDSSCFVESNEDGDPQLDALLDFYVSLNGPNWINKAGWNTSDDYCTWFGVQCADGSDISQINFIAPNNMIGTIPHSIENLVQLSIFVLIQNEVQAPIPFSSLPFSLNILKIGAVNGGDLDFDCDIVPNLQVLELVGGGFTGTVPECYANLTQLTDFVLNQNNLEGTIPLPPVSLRNLQLQNNNLNGTIPIIQVSEVFDRAYTLVLNNNSLSGTLPAFPFSIENLQLSNNLLEGTIPSLDSYNFLKFLHLDRNNLSGELPHNVTQTLLQEIFLGQNKLSGTIPDEFFELPNLTDLHLEQNNITGTISPLIANLYSLQKLTLNSNNIGGTLPPELGNNTALIYLALNNNNFTGTIPVEWSGLALMQEMFLSNNLLDGTIPVDLFSNMSKMDNLGLNNNYFSGPLPNMPPNILIWYLMYNNFTGSVPAQYGNVALLQKLSLNSNMLSGSIPDNWGLNWQNLTDMYLQNNYFEGTLPTNFQEMISIQTLDLSFNFFSGKIFSMEKMTNLLTIHLANNQLSGNLGTLENSKITELRFAQNRFTCDDLVLKNYIEQLLVVDFSSNPLNCTFSELISNMMILIPQGQLASLIPMLKVLLLSHTNLTGPLHPQLQRFSGLVWMSLSNNKLDGTIDPLCTRNENIIAQSDPALSHLDISYNSFVGPLDCLESYNYLFSLWVVGNQFSSSTDSLPPFLVPSLGPSIHLGNFTCPQLTGPDYPVSTDLPASYYHYSLCNCDPGYFGINGNCWDCPKQCTCESDKIWGCYFETEDALTTQPLIRPCKNVLGETPCNPEFLPSITKVQCAAGYDPTSRYCSMCGEGYFGSAGICTRCEGSALAVWGLTALFLMLLTLSAVGLTEPSVNYVSTLLFHYQVINSLLQLNLPWPNDKIVVGALQFLAHGSTYSIYQIQCLFPDKNGVFWYNFNFWWYAASPIMIAIWSFLIYIVGYLFQVWRRVGLLGLRNTLNPHKAWRAKCWYMLFTLETSLIYQISIATSANINSHEENNEDFLATVPNILFTYGPEYAISMAIICLILMIQILFMLALAVYKKDSTKPSFLLYATMKYRDSSTKWWLVADMMKRICLGLIQGLVPLYSILYPLFCAILFMVYIVLLTCSPYKNYRDTVAEGVSLGIIASSFIVSIALLTGNLAYDNNPSSDEMTQYHQLTWFIIILNFVCMVLGGILLCYFYVKRAKQMIEKLKRPMSLMESNPLISSWEASAQPQ